MLFTIITVCYNSSKTIAKTFDSVLSQSFKEYEHIVIDGASTDGTLDIIKEYEPRYSGRMKYISEKDNGIYDAMNKGVKLAKGDYVCFMNSDDFLEPESLGITAEWITSHPGAGVYYGFTRVISKDCEELYIIRRSHHKIPGCKNMPKHQSIYMRRDLFEKYGYFSLEYKIVSDHALMLKVYRGGETFLPMPHIVANFRSGGISTMNGNWQKLRNELQQLRVANGFEDARKIKMERLESRVCSKVNVVVCKAIHLLNRVFHFV